MDHRLVSNLEKAFGWDGPAALGTVLARGHIDDETLPGRLLTPNGLLELVMRRHLENPQLRMYAEGRMLHPTGFLETFISRRRQASGRADMDAVGRVLNEGGTLVLDTVNQFDPTLEVACRALSWWTGELVSVNAYLAVGDTAGFDMHWDDHDVVCIQVAGQKSWEVRAAARPVPMHRDAEPNPEPPEQVLWSGTMEVGDVMHIPRGFWHAATRVGSGDGVSLHLTFGTTRRTGVTWIQHLADAARDNELFRTDLETSEGPQATPLTTKLLDLACDVSAQRYLEDMREAMPPGRHLPYVPTLGPLTGAVAVTEFVPTITAGPHGLEVRGAGKKLTLASRAERWARILLSGHPVRFDDTTDPAAVRLTERFIQEGLCAPLTDVSSSGYTGLVPSETF